MTESIWATWHDSYSDPESEVSHRLVHVRRRLSDALDAAPPGPIRLISLCAGEGRDVLGVLPAHPRRPDVIARLVELNPDVAAVARASAAAAGLDNVEVVTGDAALVAAYADLAPADVVLACGIFGNVDDAAIRATIDGLRQLSKRGATVLWTRSRRTPDVTTDVRRWFSEVGFEEVGFDVEDGRDFSVGTQRFAGETPPLDVTAKLFEFLPDKR
ncbi:class I SAM-dependent methyltransferase [Mycobacterium sp. 236(2023)]|uniref:class I SAM-dependent methyltransferase n=1 Tax=Mycobacterium sp. 236(2023) TaxID=3038163 RepID=UPI0024155EE2|nr:class I SAM-dependent methyltransferase [Mycobacterium sp. 236(2023)]MDG4668854.1 class I SAM-dependent methyltransferase [Mycobacterium sp. 236(2023)]